MSKLDKEVILEIIEKLVGDTSIHGETYADNISYKNNELLGELILDLVSKMNEDMGRCFNDYRGSMKTLARLKYRHLKFIYEELGLYLEGLNENE